MPCQMTLSPKWKIKWPAHAKPTFFFQREASSAKKRKKHAQRKSSTPQHEPVLLIALQDNSCFLRNSMGSPCGPTQWVLRQTLRRLKSSRLPKTSPLPTSKPVHSLRLWSKPWKHTKVMPLAQRQSWKPPLTGAHRHTCRRHVSCFCCFVNLSKKHYRSIESDWIVEWYWTVFYFYVLNGCLEASWIAFFFYSPRLYHGIDYQGRICGLDGPNGVPGKSLGLRSLCVKAQVGQKIMKKNMKWSHEPNAFENIWITWITPTNWNVNCMAS